MKFTSAYSTKKRVQLVFTGVSKTKQSHKKECDINNLLQRYQKTGVLQHVNNQKQSYEDLTEVVDYNVALNTLIQADESFNSLPSSIRKKFNNDPAQFLEHATNPENLQSMIDMGLASKIANLDVVEDPPPTPPDPPAPAGEG